MSVATLVREQCANYQRGVCVFKSAECPVIDGGKCNVSKAVLHGDMGKSSDEDYFSACLAPLANSYPEYADAVANYQHQHGLKVTVVSRYCECGEVLATGKRFCPACLKKRRREAWKSEKEKQRNSDCRTS